MKTRIYFLFILLIGFAAANAQPCTADTLMQRIFRSVKDSNESDFRNLLPNLEQFREFQSKLVRYKPSGDTVIQFNGRPEDMYAGYIKEVLDQFRSVLRKARLRKVDLAKAKYSDATYTVFPKEGIEGKRMTGSIRFTAGEDEYWLLFSDVYWNESAKDWRGVDLMGIVNKNTALEDGDISVKEVMLKKAVMPPPPPPPPPARKKSKKKFNK